MIFSLFMNPMIIKYYLLHLVCFTFDPSKTYNIILFHILKQKNVKENESQLFSKFNITL
jgi:hypothetical protein